MLFDQYGIEVTTLACGEFTVNEKSLKTYSGMIMLHPIGTPVCDTYINAEDGELCAALSGLNERL